ncbi:MAG TPA: hypothetical protein VMM93_14315 [Vicinamibacterales bacterium]|nr:hypothetical protein [Vicinamibacterales bacterium]
MKRFRDRLVSSSVTKSERDIATELRCAADHVFIGTVEASRSLPIADGTFLFTEYTVMVTEDIVPGPGLVEGPPQGARVTVLRPGGSIQVGEHTVTAYISDVPTLVTGASYLFFEKRVGATGAYRSAHHLGTFSVSNETVKSLESLRVFEGDLARGTRKDLFVNAVRAVDPCK